MVEQWLAWSDPQCEPTHECPICRRECFGDICERCRDKLAFADAEVDYE